MGRRAFVAGLGLELVASRMAWAQSGVKVARVGYLSSGRPPEGDPLAEAFRATLRERGWIEGENLVIERRGAKGQYERLRPLADELVRLKVDVIFAGSAPSAQAAKRATATIPIVFHVLYDPVEAGLVASLARPGGNLTGNAGLGLELDQKRIDLLKEALPSASSATVLVNPGNPMTASRRKATEAAAKALKLQVRVVEAPDSTALERGLRSVAEARPDALIVADDPMFRLNQRVIIDFAAKQRIPAIYSQAGWAEQGGLLEYAPDQRKMFRQAAVYVDRILRGAKPADLPIEQPTKFDLVINLKTAKALGLTISQSLRLRADRLIE
jgi:putative ABC transport system substrate-binding protein